MKRRYSALACCLSGYLCALIAFGIGLTQMTVDDSSADPAPAAASDDGKPTYYVVSDLENCAPCKILHGAWAGGGPVRHSIEQRARVVFVDVRSVPTVVRSDGATARLRRPSLRNLYDLIVRDQQSRRVSHVPTGEQPMTLESLINDSEDLNRNPDYGLGAEITHRPLGNSANDATVNAIVEWDDTELERRRGKETVRSGTLSVKTSLSVDKADQWVIGGEVLQTTKISPAQGNTREVSVVRSDQSNRSPAINHRL